MTTENIMLQETEMTQTGFCEKCDAQSELERCLGCGVWACAECREVKGIYCNDCLSNDDEEDDDD